MTVTVSGSVALFKVPSVVRTDAAEVPTGSDGPGAKWIFPVVAFVVVTVMNVGPATFENVSASPSGSEPVRT